MSKVWAKFDLAIVGGGIVGLAIARQVALKHPRLKICLLEKEKQLATHQSQRNSGVIHCGIYYKKGSLKSRFCIKGAELVKEYCREKRIPFNQCGKLIVATREKELPVLQDLFSNATANKIKDIELIDPQRVEQIQPGCKNAIKAIWSPNTANVDWRQVALSYAEDFKELGGEIFTDRTIYRMKDSVGNVLLQDVQTENYLEANSVINCAGLFSDYFARQTGNNEHPRVVPFKGKYYLLSDTLAKTVKTNIYPVPNPKVPFLGVHITPRLDGSVLIGPTASLTLGYENYDGYSTTLVQLYHILIRSGLRKMLRNKDYLEAGLLEIFRRYSKSSVSGDVRKFLPDIKTKDLIDTDFCGIRAQVMSRDGKLIDDFIIETGVRPEFSRVIHLRNCPSPAATSSLAIADRVLGMLEERFI